MIGMSDHVCKNILFKDLHSPHFKEYYTLDEINDELKDIEGSEIEPQDDNGQVITNVVFHMSYTSFLYTVNEMFESTEAESVCDRIYRFMDLAMVKP